jgi:catechol 2,3-dioxygenase-like lactoylglutathione lyase family enzyme
MLGIEHPGILVSDLEGSIEFYKKIGFKVLRKTSRSHVMMYLGNDILEITPGLKESTPFPFHLSLHTDNIEEDVARLQKLGIEIDDVMTFSGKMLDDLFTGVVEYAELIPDNPKLLGCMTPSEKWKRVLFKDPDGISIELWQRN